MIEARNVTLRFGSRTLFEEVNIAFTSGNTYGLIGANGAGKTTFLKILSGEIDPSSGSVYLEKGRRMSILKQDQFEYDEQVVKDVVLQGNKELFDIMKAMEEFYVIGDFEGEAGERFGNLQTRFEELDGWGAESDAAIILEGLGIKTEMHDAVMSTLLPGDKVKVLLAQAVFGNPDVLLLDEPTNNLDAQAKRWLEDFLMDFPNTIITISHDRHFLNKICTHIADVDREKIQLHPGNYDFWKQSSELALELQNNANKKKEEKIKELEAFVARFSANASKSKQATSRKKQLDRISIDEITPSTRKYPYINFEIVRDLGNEILKVENLTYIEDGVTYFENLSFIVLPEHKVHLDTENDLAATKLIQILLGELEPTSGSYTWGLTCFPGYMPKDIMSHFDGKDLNMIDWLSDYVETIEQKDEQYLRTFLGRMLFSRDEPLKKVEKCSGGEKMRLMFSKLMMEKPNVMLLDDPTNHLDLESISSVNEALIKYKGVILLKTHDLELAETTCNFTVSF